MSRIIYPAQTTSIDKTAFDAYPEDPTFYCLKGSDVERLAKSKGYYVKYIEAPPVPTPLPMLTLALPASLKVLEAEALAGCAAERIVLPAGLTSIGANAFADCRNLEELVNGSELEIDRASVGLGDDVKIIEK